MAENFEGFRSLVRAEGGRLYRDLLWRRTRDPYIVWLSEVMLQQTQVARVETRMPAWLERFPTVEALAAASTPDVLEAWQGMGYNRRALALKQTACEVLERFDGAFPQDTCDLVSLPGIGPATAQGIRSFAFDLPGVYLETNVRTVVLHHFFPDVPAVPDKELVPIVRATCPMGLAASATPSERGTGGASLAFATPQDADDTPRAWYYAMLDYGARLKKIIPNPSRRSAGYARQSKFDGSRRQKRAEIVRQLLDARDAEPAGLTLADVVDAVSRFELKAGRDRVSEELVQSILSDLVREGFCTMSARGEETIWMIA